MEIQKTVWDTISENPILQNCLVTEQQKHKMILECTKTV